VQIASIPLITKFPNISLTKTLSENTKKKRPAEKHYLIVKNECILHVETFHQFHVVGETLDIALQQMIRQRLIEPCSTFANK